MPTIPVLPDDKMAHSVTLPRREPLLDKDSPDLVIIWDDGTQRVIRSGSACPALKGVHDVLEAVVHVVEVQLDGVEVQDDDQLQLVFGTVGNAAQLGGGVQFGVERTAPCRSGILVRWDADAECLAVLGHGSVHVGFQEDVLVVELKEVPLVHIEPTDVDDAVGRHAHA